MNSRPPFPCETTDVLADAVSNTRFPMNPERLPRRTALGSHRPTVSIEWERKIGHDHD